MQDPAPMANYGTRFRCGFPGCTKRYASTDGVRKHARKIHKDWLKDVDEQSTTRDSKQIYGSKPSTYCVPETGLLTGLDDGSTHGGSHYDGSTHGGNHFKTDENVSPTPESCSDSASSAPACFPGLDHLPSARAVAACLVHKPSNSPKVRVEGSSTGCKRPLETEVVGGSPRKAATKTPHQDWLPTDWDKIGALDIFCDDSRPPPLSLDAGSSSDDIADPTMTPQTTALKPSASMGSISPFELSPNTRLILPPSLMALPSAMRKTASTMSLDKFKEDAGDLDEAEYVAFLSAIMAQ